jgi:hypothetical protein
MDLLVLWGWRRTATNTTRAPRPVIRSPGLARTRHDCARRAWRTGLALQCYRTGVPFGLMTSHSPPKLDTFWQVI